MANQPDGIDRHETQRQIGETPASSLLVGAPFLALLATASCEPTKPGTSSSTGGTTGAAV